MGKLSLFACCVWVCHDLLQVVNWSAVYIVKDYCGFVIDGRGNIGGQRLKLIFSIVAQVYQTFVFVSLLYVQASSRKPFPM